jgi:hypothetical protein
MSRRKVSAYSVKTGYLGRKMVPLELETSKIKQIPIPDPIKPEQPKVWMVTLVKKMAGTCERECLGIYAEYRSIGKKLEDLQKDAQFANPASWSNQESTPEVTTWTCTNVYTEDHLRCDMAITIQKVSFFK